MKISLSASHNDCKEAIELLETCDIIYTTQVRNRDRLIDLFGKRVRFIPDILADTREYLEARHSDDKIIGFSELFELRQQYQN